MFTLPKLVPRASAVSANWYPLLSFEPSPLQTAVVGIDWPQLPVSPTGFVSQTVY